MPKRRTIEIDEAAAARPAGVGAADAAGNGEEALRATADRAEEAFLRRERQLRYLDRLAEHVDLEVLRSDEMWR
jgi:hypothetical protein